MSKRQWLILFGVWVMVFPFLGFPFFWNKVIAVITGFLICFVAYKVGGGESVRSDAKDHIPYIEHKSAPPVMKDMDMRTDITNNNTR